MTFIYYKEHVYGKEITDDYISDTSVIIYNSKLTSLEGIEDYPDLEKIYIFKKYKYGTIMDLKSISNLVKLNNLSILNYNIDDISFLSALNKLTFLDLSYNNIVDISILKNLYNLEVLRIHDNYIEDISILKNLVKLTSLNLACNNIINHEAILYLDNLKYFCYGRVIEIYKNKDVLDKLKNEIKCKRRKRIIGEFIK